MEYVSIDISDPLIVGNFFTVAMNLEGKSRETSEMYPKMEELCVYRVAEGKIVEEWFMYEM